MCIDKNYPFILFPTFDVGIVYQSHLVVMGEQIKDMETEDK